MESYFPKTKHRQEQATLSKWSNTEWTKGGTELSPANVRVSQNSQRK